MPIREYLKLAEREPILPSRVLSAILAFDVRDEGRDRGVWCHQWRDLRTRRVCRRVWRRGDHHVAHEPLAEIPRSSAQTFAVIDALRIDAFNPDWALVALPNQPISGVRTGLKMATL